MQAKSRPDPDALAVDGLHRPGQVEARARPGAEGAGDLFGQLLGDHQGAPAHGHGEHQDHRQEAGGDDHVPSEALARAQVREQQGEGDQGVDRLAEGLDRYVDDGRGRRRSAPGPAQHRQGAGADALANGRPHQGGRAVTNPAGEKTGAEGGLVGHRPPGRGAEDDRDQLQGAGFEQAGPPHRRDGVQGRLHPCPDGQEHGQGDACEEGDARADTADHATPTKSEKRPSLTWRQASMTSGSVRPASSSVGR